MAPAAIRAFVQAGCVVAGNDTGHIDVADSPGTVVTANRMLEDDPNGIELKSSPGCVVSSNEIGGLLDCGLL